MWRSTSSQIVWKKTYGGGDQEQLSSIQQTADGGYIASGGTASFGAGNMDLLVLKLDSSGTVEWKRAIGGSNYENSFCSIRQTTDLGFFIAGTTMSFGAGSSDWLLIKMDSAGNITWNKTFGGSGDDRAASADQTTDGGYVIVGCAASFGADGQDGLIVKLDSTGDVQWKKTFGGAGTEKLSSVVQTSDGGFIIGGSTSSFGAGSTDTLVLKLDANGEIPGCAYLADVTGETITDPALSVISAFALQTGIPGAGLADIVGGTSTDPNVTVTDLLQ